MPDADVLSANLNLLVALDALLEERHVTRAARRIGLTQSGMSHALGQLRDLFDDPLFVRARGGVEPTARALELAGPVRRGLEAFGEALSGRERFDPATSEAAFTLAMNDYAELVLLPPLLRELARRAPGVSLQVLPAWGPPPEGLATGALDAAVLSPPRRRSAGLHQQPLLDDDFVCIVRKGHPRVGKRLTLKRYLSESHVLVTQEPGALGNADRALARDGKRRRIAVRVPRFFMVPAVVAETDLIGLVDSRVADYFARALPLRVLRPPIRLPAAKEWAYHLVWHARSDRDPARRWLRERIAEVAVSL